VSAPEPKVAVDKLEAVKRQIDTAIWLWFNEADLVSVTSLADAAMGVLDELRQKQNLDRPMPFNTEYMAEGTTTEQARKIRDKLREAGAFAKHARHDHDMVYEYSPGFTEIYLYLAIMSYTEMVTYDLHNRRSLFHLFCLRFGFQWPEFQALGGKVFPVLDESFDRKHFQKLSRAEFFQELGGDFIGNPPRPDKS
jgi:hypothetical protein